MQPLLSTLKEPKKSYSHEGREPTLWASECSCMTSSGLKGACRRRVWVRYHRDLDRYNGVHSQYSVLPDENFNIETHNIFRLGDAAELILVGRATEISSSTQHRIELTSHKLSGRIDLLLTDGRPVEIKSVHGFGGDAIIGSPKGRRAGIPRDSHLMQLALYIHCLEADSGLLWIIDRGTGMMAEYEVTLHSGNICYEQISPVAQPRVVTSLSIPGILANYQYILDHPYIPKLDFIKPLHIPCSNCPCSHLCFSPN